MKHTSAPWTWQKFGDVYSLTAQHGMREIIISANPSRKNYDQPAVVMNKSGVLEDIDPKHPNAQLIAAAPELLEALETLLNDSCYEGMTGEWFMWAKDNSEISEACKKAKSAIAKAKGS